MQTTHAVSNFSGVLQRKFAYLHCWDLMKDEPKWQDPNARDMASAARGEGFGEPSYAGSDPGQAADGQCSPVRSRAQSSRPMGRDAAKAAKKKVNSDAGSTSSAEFAARMQEISLERMAMMKDEVGRRNERFEEMRKHNEALLKIEQEKMQMKREEHELSMRRQQDQDDERILRVDLDACPPALRLYYQTRQEQILEAVGARRRSSQPP